MAALLVKMASSNAKEIKTMKLCKSDLILSEGDIGIFGFAFLAIFRSVFELKTLVFRFCYSLQFADFPLLSICFAAFAKNTNGFSVFLI